MGYDYTYHLYLFKEDVWTMLRALGQYAASSLLASQHTLVHLPGGEVIAVPFTSHFKTDPLFYAEQTPSLAFDVVLGLHIDSDERQMFRDGGWEIDEQGMVRFGYMDLDIDLRPEKANRLVSFRFTAVTDGMSDLMKHSRSLRQVFCELLAKGNGVCGILDLDGVKDEAMLWWLDGKEMVQWFPEPTEEEVGETDRWNCQQFDGLVEGWLRT